MPGQGKPQGVSAWSSIRAAAAGSLFSWILIKSQFFADCADKTNWPKDGPGLCTLSNPPWFGGVFLRAVLYLTFLEPQRSRG
jgi:hypothetical protein